MMKTNRIAFFIDGFNVYHALDYKSAYHKYKWLNLRKLAECFVLSRETIVGLFYFTAYTPWNLDKRKRHEIYIRALKSVNVEIVLGAFRPVERICNECHKKYRTFEEKCTDVNISVTLFKTAIDDIWDKAMIVSGDSDLIPAIEAVKAKFPEKQIVVIIPIGRRAELLKQITDGHMKIKQRHLKASQFPDIISVTQNQQLNRPATWI